MDKDSQPPSDPALASASGSGHFYVVSNVWMGRAEHCCKTATQAARNQYLEMRQQHGREVTPEQFRAWPVETWPHTLSFEQAFEWIGQNVTRPERPTLRLTCGRNHQRTDSSASPGPNEN